MDGRTFERERLANMNPFPGMNPYLEEANLWRTVHAALIYLIFETVNAQLPTGFRAAIDERITIVPPSQDFLPDVMVTRRLPPTQTSGSGQRSITVLDPRANTPRHGVVSQPLRVAERFVQIMTGDQWKEVVTVIEILSPTNKAQNSMGRRVYRTKQRRLLNSDANLLEIDLLRGGVHTVAAPHTLLQPYGAWDYLISTHRFWMPDQFEYWLSLLAEPLPEITVPLLPESDEPKIDLQSLLNRIYVQGRFEEAIDYNQPPPIPMSEEQSAWMDVLLREKGLRT